MVYILLHMNAEYNQNYPLDTRENYISTALLHYIKIMCVGEGLMPQLPLLPITPKQLTRI